MTRTTTTTNAASAAERTDQMSASFEAEVREFAREFPTPNVLRALALCESGALPWAKVHEVFRASLARGLAEVAP